MDVSLSSLWKRLFASLNVENISVCSCSRYRVRRRDKGINERKRTRWRKVEKGEQNRNGNMLETDSGTLDWYDSTHIWKGNLKTERTYPWRVSTENTISSICDCKQDIWPPSSLRSRKQACAFTSLPNLLSRACYTRACQHVALTGVPMGCNEIKTIIKKGDKAWLVNASC